MSRTAPASRSGEALHSSAAGAHRLRRKAIFPEDELPEQWKRYIEMDADYYRLNSEAFKSKWGEEP
jgi:hypothetical protein